MSDFSLAAAVRAALDETDLTDPFEIGRKIAESVPSKALRPALAEAVSYMVRTQFGRDRMARLGPVLPSRSSKVAALQADAERWRAALHTRVSLGPNQFAMLGDLSYENLQYAAEDRRAKAAQNAAAAARFEWLAEQVQTHGVDRVRDLPDSLLRSFFDEGEATA
jgi:hypothetical protein